VWIPALWSKEWGENAELLYLRACRKDTGNRASVWCRDRPVSRFQVQYY